MRRVRHTKKPDTTSNSPGLEEKIEQKRMLEEGRKADWDKPDEKHCIVRKGEAADKQIKSFESCILAFPTYEVRDQFLDSFRDLIEEAKELL